MPNEPVPPAPLLSRPLLPAVRPPGAALAGGPAWPAGGIGHRPSALRPAPGPRGARPAAAGALAVCDDEAAHLLQLERLLGQCRRLARPVALLLVRVAHGPAPDGDATTVRLLGQRLRSRVRAADVVTRLGADRLTALLFDVDDRLSRAVQRRLTLQLGEPCGGPGRSAVVPALHIGRALPGLHGRLAADLLRAADHPAGAPWA